MTEPVGLRGRSRISANARRRKSGIESRGFATQIAALLRSVGDLVLQVARLMIAAELAQRRLVQLKQNLAQLLGFHDSRLQNSGIIGTT